MCVRSSSRIISVLSDSASARSSILRRSMAIAATWATRETSSTTIASAVRGCR